MFFRQKNERLANKSKLLSKRQLALVPTVNESGSSFSPNVEFHIYCKFPENFSLPDRSYVIAGLDPAISPAKGIPASERGNDIVSYKSKLGLLDLQFPSLI